MEDKTPNNRKKEYRSLRSTMAFFSRSMVGALCAMSLSAFANAAHADGIVFDLPALGSTSYSFTSTTLATYRSSDYSGNPYNNQFLGLTERFDSAFSAAPWRLQLRFDGFLPFQFTPFSLGLRTPCDPVGDCLAYLRPDFRLERIALRYQRNGITAELGDFYVVMGRGIAVSFRKVDPLGLDTTLRGAHVAIERGRILARLFGGYANPQNLDPIRFAVNADWGVEVARGMQALRPFPDVLLGGEFSARFGPDEEFETGVTYVRGFFPLSRVRSTAVDVFGYRFSAPSLLDGTLALHAELHALRRVETRVDPSNTSRVLGEDTRWGRALYFTAQLQRGNWSFVTEWKDYSNYLLSPSGTSVDERRIYSGAPALEREDVQLRTNANVRGGRLRIEHAFRPSPWTLSVTGASSGFREEVDRDPWSSDGFGAVHGYLILRRRNRGDARPAAETSGAAMGSAATGSVGGGGASGGDWLLTATAGFRHEFLLGPREIASSTGILRRETGTPDWQVAHADIDVTFPINANHSLEIRVDGRYERRWTDFLQAAARPGYYEFTRSGIALTWSWQDRLQVSALARVDTLNLSLGNVITSPDGSRSEFPWFYPAGEIRYMFIPGSTLRLFGGMTPGGRLCSGGVCRDVPPFQGALLELVLRI